MNIFVLDRDPATAAQMHCDKHVVKMVLESAQLLCTAAHLMGLAPAEIYRPTHAKHPCTVWAASDMAHYRWLHLLFMNLMQEYTHRYGKAHACHRLHKVLRIWPQGALYDMPRTFAQAMPDEYKHDDPVVAYRRYYLGAKSNIARWNRSRPAPAWWQQPEELCQ